jgi:glycerol-3-phosphate acyltransferase PlsY
MKLVSFFAFFVLSFLLGSLPFSVWIGRLFSGRDVRAVGDGNPGATNTLKAAGWRAGLLALMLDITKGALPVGLAWVVFTWRGWEIVPLALAPVLGHAFSPFLGGKGGKALAVSLGIWIGLLLWKAPLYILPVLSLAYLIQDNAGWALAAALVSLAAGLSFEANALFWWLYALQAVLLLWKHRADFRQRPHLRRWAEALLQKLRSGGRGS